MKLTMGMVLSNLRRSVSSIVTRASITAIQADGWSANDSAPVTFDPVADPQYLVASRQGYDTSGGATTISEAMVITEWVRQAYPSQASLTANRVALSDYVYSTDTIAGVTNSSAEASPKPICNWAMPDRIIVGGTVHLEVLAYHRNARSRSQVAAVEFSATDGTTTVTQIVSAMTISARGGDANPVIVYQCDLDISTLANPATITCNAKAYPWIGAATAVADSAGSSVAREFSPRYFRRDTAAQRVAYVRTAANGGNDGTGVVSTTPATASANPFLTVLAAINAMHTAGGLDGGTIYIGNDGGTPFVIASTAATRTQSHSALTITREDGVARANARVSFGAAAFRPRFGASGGWLRFLDVGVIRTGTGTILGEAASQLVITFDNVTFDNGSFNAAMLSNSHVQFFGVTFSGLAGSLLNAGTYEIRAIRGCNIPTGTANIEGWLLVGNTITTSAGFMTPGSRTANGMIVAYNKFMSITYASATISIGASTSVDGFAVVGNLFEYISATSAPMVYIGADAAAGSTTHVIIQHNTYAGFYLNGRDNLFYDEGPTRRTHRLMSVSGNLHVQINTKSDVFRGVNEGGADASSAVGNWAYMYGVGSQGEFSQFIDASEGGIGSAFAQAYPGLRAKIGTSATVRQDPLFVDYKGTSSGPTAGTGGGNYALQAGSPAKAMAMATLPFDMAGNARSATTSAGAYE